jgi:phage repressor protein C with HTH and peptisase S24 domain
VRLPGRRVRPGLVVVRGRSMQPTLSDGDLLLVGWGAAPRTGRVAVVRLPDDASGRPRPPAVKRLVRREPGGWWVERDSPVEGVDSWQVGAVPERDVLAVVLARLWPRPARALPDPRE